jgi:hypothetical protein
MNSRVRILIALCLPLLFCDAGYAQEYTWHFDDARNVLHWKAIDASMEQGPSGAVIIRGNDTFWFVSPPNLSIPPRVSYAEFKLKAPVTYLMGYLIMRTADNRTWQADFQLGIPDRFDVYSVNIQKGNTGNAPINSFAFAFGGLDKVELEYVRCYEPSAIDLVGIYWREFWNASYAKATSVNFIDSPFVGNISLLTLLYVFLILFVVCMIVVLRPVNASTIMKSVVVSFIAAGMLFALRMDYTWYMMWRLDSASLSHKSLDERVSLVDGTGAYAFAEEVKKIIPPGENVRIYGGDVAVKLKYYLLPLKVSDNGKYIAVCKGSALTYDPAGKVLRGVDAVIANNVSLIKVFKEDFSLYRIGEAVQG